MTIRLLCQRYQNVKGVWAFYYKYVNGDNFENQDIGPKAGELKTNFSLKIIVPFKG